MLLRINLVNLHLLVEFTKLLVDQDGVMIVKQQNNARNHPKRYTPYTI